MAAAVKAVFLAAVTVIAALLFGAAPASSHLVGFTEPGTVHDLFTPALTARCIFGPNNCSTHSWSFISSNQIEGNNFWTCAEIWEDTDHGISRGFACAFGLARKCYQNNFHAGGDGPLHCQDAADSCCTFHVGGYNGDFNLDHTLRRHGVY
jgi:hypothetical protein